MHISLMLRPNACHSLGGQGAWHTRNGWGFKRKVSSTSCVTFAPIQSERSQRTSCRGIHSRYHITQFGSRKILCEMYGNSTRILAGSRRWVKLLEKHAIRVGMAISLWLDSTNLVRLKSISRFINYKVINSIYNKSIKAPPTADNNKTREA